jgi:hypothetical protein
VADVRLPASAAASTLSDVVRTAVTRAVLSLATLAPTLGAQRGLAGIFLNLPGRDPHDTDRVPMTSAGRFSPLGPRGTAGPRLCCRPLGGANGQPIIFVSYLEDRSLGLGVLKRGCHQAGLLGAQMPMNVIVQKDGHSATMPIP